MTGLSCCSIQVTVWFVLRGGKANREATSSDDRFYVFYLRNPKKIKRLISVLSGILLLGTFFLLVMWAVIDSTTSIVVAAIILILVILLTAAVVKEYQNVECLVKIDHKGITDHNLFSSIGFIPWDKIDGVRPWDQTIVLRLIPDEPDSKEVKTATLKLSEAVISTHTVYKKIVQYQKSAI